MFYRQAAQSTQIPQTHHQRSLKSSASLAKSPTKTIWTQSNHFFVSIYAFFKLERMKIARKMNHFAVRSGIYIKAIGHSGGLSGATTDATVRC
jgi:hypothetical protein